MEQLAKVEAGTTSAQGFPVLDSQNVVPCEVPTPRPLVFQVALPHAAGWGVRGGFPPATACSDQHHCRDSSTSVEYIILNSQRSCQHHCVTQPTNLPHNPCDWCHQQGVPITCLRGILPQHDIVRHTCPCPCPCSAAGVSGDPSQGTTTALPPSLAPLSNKPTGPSHVATRGPTWA